MLNIGIQGSAQTEQATSPRVMLGYWGVTQVGDTEPDTLLRVFSKCVLIQ